MIGVSLMPRSVDLEQPHVSRCHLSDARDSMLSSDDVMSQQEIDDKRHRSQYTADGAWWNSTVTIDGVPSMWVKSIKIEQEAGEMPTCTIVYNMPAIDADLKGMKVIYQGEADA
jgi:hypothetical protein